MTSVCSCMAVEGGSCAHAALSLPPVATSRSTVAHPPQDLTVRENLAYSARLRLSRSKPKKEQLELVDDVITMLQLRHATGAPILLHHRDVACHAPSAQFCRCSYLAIGGQARVGQWLYQAQRAGTYACATFACRHVQHQVVGSVEKRCIRCVAVSRLAA